jgi:NADH-quinone oxidoreductase subunit C
VDAAARERQQQLQARLAAAFGAADAARDMPVLNIAPDAVLAAARRLKSEFAFDLLASLTAVDWPQRERRFDVVWHFYSTRTFTRVRVKTQVGSDSPTVDSLLPLYGAAGYMERECHEMYGIAFDGNPDLRPILLYEGFVGHPLRKDYPKTHEQPLVPYRDAREFDPAARGEGAG